MAGDFVQQQTSRFFNSEGELNKYASAEREWLFREPKNGFLDHIKKLPKNSSVIDIGGGGGVHCNLIKKTRPDIDCTVIDNSGEMLNSCRKNFPGIRTIHGDILKTGLPEKYDVIMANFILHHLTADGREQTMRNIGMAVEKMVAASKKETVFFISEHITGTPLQARLVYFLTKLSGRTGIRTPHNSGAVVYFLSKAEFDGLMEKNGLKKTAEFEYRYKKGLVKTAVEKLFGMKTVSFILKRTS
ncbi:MAG: class I SAM-dependent methyltransferase [Candidatus Diapherotrites archaeon]|nr:class I SAM-dependent methyltransferase [Candidatus Diapherotrites archaeon]